MYEVQERLGNNLKRLRRRLGLSQIQLAGKIGISTSHLGEIETGTKWPSARTLQLIVDTLGVGPEEVFKDRELVAAESDRSEPVTRAVLMQLQLRINALLDEAMKLPDASDH
ncbi:MAG: helix-turn-helix domain-containing protein [Alkalispirochaetaceae bacterium]